MAPDARIEDIEAAGRSIWSPDEEATVSGWQLSASGGYTRRLNSATTSGAADTSIETGRALGGWFAARSLPLIVRVTPLIDPVTVRAAARTWHLEHVDPTLVMAKPAAAVPGPEDVTFAEPADETFASELFRLNGRERTHLTRWRGIVSRLDGRGTGLRIGDVGVGFVGVEAGIGCVYSIAVDPSRRRMGIASRLMRAAESWSHDRGADLMTLQVVAANAPAVALYDHLGYRTRYEYHYLQSPTH
jgi:N-acetylglutamate synthase